eukprot:scaffold1087_cov198-Pinguiococcus_pyrenoidosus.AAC.8
MQLAAGLLASERVAGLEVHAQHKMRTTTVLVHRRNFGACHPLARSESRRTKAPTSRCCGSPPPC